MKKNKFHLLLASILTIIGIVFQLSLQKIMQPYAYDGYRFQAWSSEDFMQTVSIEDLRKAPWESLSNIHIQPPGYDALRALLVQFWPKLEIHAALKNVDLSIYFLWTVVYSLCGAIIFLWLAETTNLIFAFISTLFFLLHPGLIYYTTFLDTTLSSAVLILWMFYILWKIQRGETPTFSLITVLLLLFFTRSLFQWQFIPVLAISLFLLKMPIKKAILTLACISVIFGLYIFKQKEQFNLTSTSSFTGINLTSALNITKYDHPYTIEGILEDKEGIFPSVLGRTKKINGTINYNNYQYLGYNKKLTNKVVVFLKKFRVQYLINNAFENLTIYFKPSSRYTTPHIIVDRLPWRKSYDKLFSTPFQQLSLIIAITISAIEAIKRKKIASSIALLLPALYIFSLCVLFEKGENNRYKFFLEPVFYVFTLSQLFVLYTWIKSRMFLYFKK